MKSYDLFVGVDIAATTATAAWMPLGGTPSRAVTIQQTSSGFASLQRHLVSTGTPPNRVLAVMEATSTYWVTLVTTLHRAGFAVAVINPAQAHSFAKALLKRSKTDAIDAQTLAQLAALLQPSTWTPPPAIYTEVQQRLVQRDTLVELRTRLRNQLHALLQQPVVIDSVRSRIEELITTLDEQISALEQEIADTLRADDQWGATAARLQTITGVRVLTAAWLLVATLNFTICTTPKAAAGYAGLVPRLRQSGTSVRGRPTLDHAGNSRLRRALYLATLSATRYNPIIKTFYDRLLTAGKPVKVARCAAARKLLSIAWAVATKKRDFDPNYATRQQDQAVTSHIHE